MIDSHIVKMMSMAESTLDKVVGVKGMSLRDLSRNRKNKSTKPVEDDSINAVLSCESCGAKPLVPVDGFMVCNACGLCQSRDIDSSQEWRNHDNNDKGGVDQSRVCLPNNCLMPDSGLGTVIGYSSNRKNNTTGAHIVRTMNNWKLMNYKESSTYKRFKYITTVCRQADISNMIVEEAKIIFFKISNLVSARRTKLTSLMATSVIIAHKLKGYDKDMNEIAKIFALDVRILRKMVKDYERIWKEIQEKEDAEQTTLASDSIASTDGITAMTTDNYQVAPVSTASITHHEQQVITVDDNKKLRKYLIDLGVEPIYFDDVFKINNWVQDRNLLISHIPKSRYACMIYLLDQIYELGINKSSIIAACDTSNVTINKCFNKLVPYYEQIKTLLT